MSTGSTLSWYFMCAKNSLLSWGVCIHNHIKNSLLSSSFFFSLFYLSRSHYISIDDIIVLLHYKNEDWNYTERFKPTNIVHDWHYLVITIRNQFVTIMTNWFLPKRNNYYHSINYYNIVILHLSILWETHLSCTPMLLGVVSNRRKPVQIYSTTLDHCSSYSE